MKYHLLVALIIGICPSLAQSTEAGIQQWRLTALEKIGRVGSELTSTNLIGLLPYLRVAERGEAMTNEHREVFEAAKITILASPNHSRLLAEAIEDSIQTEYQKVRDPSSVPANSPSRADIFTAMKYLPSPGSVTLLGELLEDDRDPWKDKPPSDARPPLPNRVYAVRTLDRLGIENVPVLEGQGNGRFEAALNQWKLWYAQVKSGTRTFRFKGDPQEYSLAGPVKEVRAPKTGASEMPSRTPSGNAASENKKSSSFPASLVAGAVALLGVSLWYATKGKLSKR